MDFVATRKKNSLNYDAFKAFFTFELRYKNLSIISRQECTWRIEILNKFICKMKIFIKVYIRIFRLSRCYVMVRPYHVYAHKIKTSAPLSSDNLTTQSFAAFGKFTSPAKTAW